MNWQRCTRVLWSAISSLKLCNGVRASWHCQGMIVVKTSWICRNSGRHNVSDKMNCMALLLFLMLALLLMTLGVLASGPAVMPCKKKRLSMCEIHTEDPSFCSGSSIVADYLDFLRAFRLWRSLLVALRHSLLETKSFRTYDGLITTALFGRVDYQIILCPNSYIFIIVIHTSQWLANHQSPALPSVGGPRDGPVLGLESTLLHRVYTNVSVGAPLITRPPDIADEYLGWLNTYLHLSIAGIFCWMCVYGYLCDWTVLTHCSQNSPRKCTQYGHVEDD